jgi:hypothetical protein
MLKYFRYNGALYENNPMDPLAQPKWFCLDKNKNSWEALVKYAWKEKNDLTAAPSEQIDQKYKGPVDVHRYGMVWLRGRGWEQVRPTSGSSTIDAIRRGRIPKQFRSSYEGDGFNAKGRQVLAGVRA